MGVAYRQEDMRHEIFDIFVGNIHELIIGGEMFSNLLAMMYVCHDYFHVHVGKDGVSDTV